MKKIISACLISTMLTAPCANYASAASPFNSLFEEVKKECNDVHLCKKVWDHPIFSAVGIFAALHVVDKAFPVVKEKIDTNLGYQPSKYKGGYTHKEVDSLISYSLPNISYSEIYTAPEFKSNPSSDKGCNVYYSTTGKIQLKLDDKQKEHFSDRGYVSVKLRDIPQKKVGKFKRPLIWLYGKLTNKELNKYNEFYIHGPNLPKPTFVNYFKQFLPFVHSPNVSFLSCLKNVLPWTEEDFEKINYGIVLTNKDEETVLNFKAPTTSDYTKEYLDLKKINEAHKDEKLAPYEYDCIEDVTTYNKDGKPVNTVTKKKVNSPLSTIQKYYTGADIKKLKDENDKKKAVVLSKLANACQDNYITNGEIARLSLQNPEQTFRLVINNANEVCDADRLSVLLSRAAGKTIDGFHTNPNLLFDFEYVLPLPDKLKNESEVKQSNAAKIIKEVNSIEPSGALSSKKAENKSSSATGKPDEDEKDSKKSDGTHKDGSENDPKNLATPNSGSPSKPSVSVTVNGNTSKPKADQNQSQKKKKKKNNRQNKKRQNKNQPKKKTK